MIVALFHANSLLPLSQGFLLCASLIIAIGPQNLFILQQGARRQYLLLTALLCTLFDLLLIMLGVGGVGATIAANEQWLMATTLGGITFLLGYGVRSLRSAWIAQPAMNSLTDSRMLTLRGTILATVSFSFLNPSSYIDTVLMIGTASSRFPFEQRFIFGVGAVIASALWFFALIYGSSRLAPLLQRPIAWRVLDLISGSLMIAIAASLCLAHTAWFW